MRLLTIPQAAEQLGVHRSAIYRLIGEGALDVVDVAATGERRRLRIAEPELDRFIAARTIPRPAA